MALCEYFGCIGCLQIHFVIKLHLEFPSSDTTTGLLLVNHAMLHSFSRSLLNTICAVVTVLRKEISKSAKTLALSNIVRALATPKTKCLVNADKRVTSYASEVGKGVTKEVRAELGLEV